VELEHSFAIGGRADVTDRPDSIVRDGAIVPTTWDA
jgi:hypothetical protein